LGGRGGRQEGPDLQLFAILVVNLGALEVSIGKVTPERPREGPGLSGQPRRAINFFKFL